MKKKHTLLIFLVCLAIFLLSCDDSKKREIILEDTVSFGYTSSTSYDFSENTSYDHPANGDFYFYDNDTSVDGFYANNAGQNGVQDLGTYYSDLDTVKPPSKGYITQKVDIALNHTYVSIAADGEDNYYIVFNIDAFDDTANTVTLHFQYIYYK